MKLTTKLGDRLLTLDDEQGDLELLLQEPERIELYPPNTEHGTLIGNGDSFVVLPDKSLRITRAPVELARFALSHNDLPELLVALDAFSRRHGWRDDHERPVLHSSDGGRTVRAWMAPLSGPVLGFNPPRVDPLTGETGASS